MIALCIPARLPSLAFVKLRPFKAEMGRGDGVEDINAGPSSFKILWSRLSWRAYGRHLQFLAPKLPRHVSIQSSPWSILWEPS